MTKQFEDKIQEIIDEACDECEYRTDGCESLFLESQVKDIVQQSIKGIWHKPDEEPKEGVEILFAWASASRLKMFHDIGYYDRILIHIATQRTTWSLPEIERWAYLSDLEQL